MNHPQNDEWETRQIQFSQFSIKLGILYRRADNVKKLEGVNNIKLTCPILMTLDWFRD